MTDLRILRRPEKVIAFDCGKHLHCSQEEAARCLRAQWRKRRFDNEAERVGHVGIGELVRARQCAEMLAEIAGAKAP